MPTEIPRAIRALWRPVDEPPRRGPKPALSIDAIAAAGVAIADADGLDSVSMAAVAKRLGFSAMALYRYVDAKETLLALMVDAAYGPPPRLRARTWRPALTAWANAMLDGLRAHPWAAHVHTGPPLTPNAIAWMDLGLGILIGAGIDEQPAASALLVVDGYVRNHVTMEQMYADGSAVAWAPALRSLLGPDQFLAVQAGLDAGVFDDDPGDASEAAGERSDRRLVFPADQFGFGLGLVLDGIARLIDG